MAPLTLRLFKCNRIKIWFFSFICLIFVNHACLVATVMTSPHVEHFRLCRKFYIKSPLCTEGKNERERTVLTLNENILLSISYIWLRNLCLEISVSSIYVQNSQTSHFWLGSGAVGDGNDLHQHAVQICVKSFACC